MNEVISTIRQRRSIRKYKPEQLSGEELQHILEAGTYAPSGGNSQTSHLLVIRKKEILSELKSLVVQEFSRMEIYEGMYRSIIGSINASKNGEYDFIYNAPTLVVIANKKGYPNAIADCACVLENMMLAAASLNIGSCWINQLHWLDENSEIRSYLQKLGLGEDETICGGLALGYPDMAQQPLNRTGNRITLIQ